jgi:hypothetical protein
LINRRLGQLLQKQGQRFGGYSIVFAGNFYQLEPVKAVPLYGGTPIPEFHHSTNCFIELNGTHRFKNNRQQGEILSRICDGIVMEEDLKFINKKCYALHHLETLKGIQVITPNNKKRDAINSCIFEQYCDGNQPGNGSVLETAVLILMDNLQIVNAKNTHTYITDVSMKKYFYEQCSESACKYAKMKHIDLVLKLYYHCPLMMIENTNVPNGQANGSQVRLLGLNVKHGEQPFVTQLESGARINVFYASQLEGL